MTVCDQCGQLAMNTITICFECSQENEREAADEVLEDEEPFIECGDCEGFGFSDHDCGEDTCCCLDKSDDICVTCGGEGWV